MHAVDHKVAGDARLCTEACVLTPVYRRVSVRIIPPLLLAYIVAYLDRVNVGFAKLQMLDSLHFTETVYGLGAGVFFIGYFAFGLPSNLILHRFGARRWLSAMMLGWSVVSAATVLVSSPTAFYALRLLLGIAEAGFFPGVIFYLTLWYPTGRRAQVTATFMTAVAICGAIGSPLSGWIMQALDGYHGWAGWQWLFLIEAIPAALMGIYLLLRLTDEIGQAHWLNASEKSALAAQLKHGVGTEPVSSVWSVFRSSRVWMASLVYFCLLTGLYGIGFWLPTILVELGIHNPLQVGLLAALPYAVAVLGMVLVGRSADRHTDQRWHVAIPAALGAIGLVASVLLSHERALALAALAMAVFGILTGPPLFWGIASAHLRGPAAAAGIAMINSLGCLAGFASPYMVGLVKDLTGSTRLGMELIAGLVLLGALLVISMESAGPLPEAHVERLEAQS